MSDIYVVTHLEADYSSQILGVFDNLALAKACEDADECAITERFEINKQMDGERIDT